MAPEAADKGKSVHRSFRVKAQYMADLEEEARSQGESVNAILNKILKQYVEFDKFRQEQRMVSLSRPVFRTLLEGIPEDRIEELGATVGAYAVKDRLAALGLSATYENVLKIFGLTAPQGVHHYRREMTKRGHTYYVTHDLGKTASLFVKSMLTAAIEGITGLKPSVEVLENSFIITIPHKH